MGDMVVDIWDSCVSRDIFGMDGEKGYRISNFFQGCPFYTQFSEHSGPDLNIGDFEVCGSNLVNFYKKCAIVDYNKTLLDLLDSNGAEWKIIDLRYLLYDLVKIEYPGEVRNNFVYEYVSSSYVKCLDTILSNKGLKTVKTVISPDCLDFDDSFQKFTDYLINRHSSNIILVETLESFEQIGVEGELIDQWRSEKNISILAEYNYRLLEKTGAYYVKRPYNVVADSLHKLKVDRVHYISEYYRYVKDCIDYIIDSTDDRGEKQIKLDLKYSEICYVVSKIRSGVINSVNNALMRVKNNYAVGKDKEALENIFKLIEQECPDAFGYLGRAYCDGKSVEKDAVKVEEYLLKAANHDISWARIELFDLSWQKRIQEGDQRALTIIQPLVDCGNENAVQRMGCAYRDGRGIDRDLFKAAELMRYAISKKVNWDRIEQFDILLLIGGTESINEAIELIQKYASEGNGFALERLARLYWKGIRLEKDLNKAEQFMKMSADKRVPWAKAEYGQIILEKESKL